MTQSDNRDMDRKEKKSRKNGIKVRATFCPESAADVFDTVEWSRRTAAIKGDNGEVLFEQTDVEIPAAWSQLAANVVVSKYFYGEAGTAQREVSVRQLIHRVTRTLTDWGIADGYFATEKDGERFYRDLTWLCLHSCAAFNSPVWFNVGLYQAYGITGTACNWRWSSEDREAVMPENPYEFPQGSACFIQSVDDNMESIMNLASSEALLFKFGSGTGTDLSTLRSCREKLSGGGRPSGPLSFMRVYDQIAAVVKSGGKTRRAAKMQSLKVSHPDIKEFIDCKFREEEKARILVREGLSYENAYSSILFQNANLSVRVSDEFMKAVENNEPWATHWVTDPNHEGPVYGARELFDKIAQTAWNCGDPGLQYDTTINNWHTCPANGRINASNPCSEYMFLDNSACNLASINLMQFRREGGVFDSDAFIAACRLIFIAQDILVDHASYPIKRIAENSHYYRPIGLGYTNLGSLLMSLGLPYDSDEARGLASAITALLHGAACRTSAELAGSAGPFERWTENKTAMLKVIDKHWEAVNHIQNAPRYLKRAAQELWDDVVELGQKNGFRNAQQTVLAPTGTISFMMDCDTTGIEPDIALVKFKQLAGGGTFKMVNRTVALALETLGYGQADIDAIVKFIEENRYIEGAPGLLPEHLPVFDCAFPAPGGSNRCITWQGHVKMMAAAQPFISGAISKTVNLPNSATPEDVAAAYMMGWKLGLKALAVYRDGSKSAQPLSTSDSKKEKKADSAPAAVSGQAEKTPVKSETAPAESQPISAAAAEASAAESISVVNNTSAAEIIPEDDRPRSRRRRGAGFPRRERLPDTRQSVTHKFNVAGHEGYITVGLYPDNRVGELFITMAKEGSTIGGLMDCFSTALSMSLQYGVPLKVYVEKFSHTRFEPMGYTKNPDIPIAKSLVDYIFRWLGSTFLQEPIPTPHYPETAQFGEIVSSDHIMENGHTHSGGESAASYQPASGESIRLDSAHEPQGPHFPVEEANPTLFIEPGVKAAAEPVTPNEQYAEFQSDAPVCDQCGSICVRSGNCYLCYNCGRSMGCS